MSRALADLKGREGRIDLALTSPFPLGGLEIRPASREACGPLGTALAEPRALQVLVALAEADGEVVSRDELIRRCWDGRIVGEDAIHRAVAKARRLAELADPPAFAIESVARVGYRLVPNAAAATLAGKPGAPALPTPLQVAGAGDRRTAVNRRLLLGGAGVLMMGAVAGAAALRPWRRPSAAEPLIAVLPFDDLSPDADLRYFADGLSEDILNALLRSGGLRVTARSSSFTFRGAAKAKAAEALRADYLLDGSVLRDATNLRVNAHLDQARGGQTLWSATFDRPLGQGLAVEDEIAARVAEALKVRIVHPPRSGAQSIDAATFDMFLKAREAVYDHTPETVARGARLIEEVVRRAPDFAPGWFELAKNCLRRATLEPLAAQAKTLEVGRHAAERALALDPRNGAALGAQAFMTPFYGRWVEREALFSRAAALAPNDSDLLLWRGHEFTETGWLEFAVGALKRGQAMDPLELYANHQLFMALLFADRLEEAERLSTRIAAIWPESVAAYWDRFWVLFGARRDKEAIAHLHAPMHAKDEIDERRLIQAVLLAAGGNDPSARRTVIRDYLTLPPLGMGYATNGLMLFARLGAWDETLALARAIYLQSPEIKVNREVQFQSNSRYVLFGQPDPMWLFHPGLAPLRRSGKLDEVFRAIGLSDLWTKAGRPPM